MLDPSGGFYSAQDADSEGEEGALLRLDARRDRGAALDGCVRRPGTATPSCSSTAYGVTPGGNFEGKSILFVARTAAEIAADARTDRRRGGGAPRTLAARRCSSAREQRVKPGLDDKVLAGWNGLMLAAFAEAARVLGRDDYLRDRRAQRRVPARADARRPTAACCARGRTGTPSSTATSRTTRTSPTGCSSSTRRRSTPRWFAAARELGDAILEHFADPDGGFFDTSDDHETLLVRPKGVQDGAVPSGGAMAAGVLLRLAEYTGEGRYADAADGALAAQRPLMARAPLGSPTGSRRSTSRSPRRKSSRSSATTRAAARGGARPLPAEPGGGRRTIGRGSGIALLAGREALDGKATAYVCRQFSCERPVTTPEELAALLQERERRLRRTPPARHDAAR